MFARRSLQVIFVVCLFALFYSASANKCGKNELWEECASCEASCEYPSPICSMECEKPKCLCPQGAGLVRLPDGSCGHKSECKKQKMKKKLRMLRSVVTNF